jgi:acyl-CoA hydrolase
VLPNSFFRVLLALLVLTGCGDSARYEHLPPGSTVLAFGDSVTHGTGAGDGEDFPARLAAISGWNVINAGIPGDTAREARRRLEPLLSRHDPALVLIELGGNDFLRKRRDADVKADLETMVEHVQDHGAIPVLVAVPRLSLLRARAGALKDSDIYAAIAESRDVPLVREVFSAVLSDETLRADPIHPNAEGYRVMAEGISAQLESLGLLNP